MFSVVDLNVPSTGGEISSVVDSVVDSMYISVSITGNFCSVVIDIVVEICSETGFPESSVDISVVLSDFVVGTLVEVVCSFIDSEVNGVIGFSVPIMETSVVFTFIVIDSVEGTSLTVLCTVTSAVLGLAMVVVSIGVFVVNSTVVGVVGDSDFEKVSTASVVGSSSTDCEVNCKCVVLSSVVTTELADVAVSIEVRRELNDISVEVSCSFAAVLRLVLKHPINKNILDSFIVMSSF